MSVPTESAVLIEGISADVENDLREAMDDLRQGGLDCQFRYRQPEPQAFVEWLAATAVLIWLGDKYFGAMLEEMAKDHYQILKRGLRTIYDKTLGPTPNVTRVIRQVDGKVRRDKVFSGNLSFRYRSPEGWLVTLLFPLNISPERYEQSCNQFSSLIRQYLQQPTESPLNAEIDSQANDKLELLPPEVTVAHKRPSVSLLVFWDDATQNFRVPDVVASGSTASLVSWPLGNRI